MPEREQSASPKGNGEDADAGNGTPQESADSPQAMEERWLRFWEEEGVYRYDPDSDKPVYAIDTPPPTVSGKMHIGHAYSYNQMDFVARYKRMRGHNLYYPFGFDDNGLPTERLTEREVGVKLTDVGREEFIRKCLEVTRKFEDYMEQAWRRIGTSCDWSLVYRTIDDHPRRTSQASFVDLHQQERAYRKESPTIWCPECHTAIAQAETEDAELPSTFNDIRFDLQPTEGAEGPDHVVIATTRPELLPACVAVFVHPDDERADGLVGRTAKVPLFGQEVPILADATVDMEKGSGVVMCCTFGDLHDIDWYHEHELPLAIAIDERGRMTERADGYEGLTTEEARARIIRDLDEAGHLLEQEDIVHAVNVHERCGTPIEFLVTKQWFVRYLDLKDRFLEMGDEIHWHPPHMKVRYDNWVKGLKWDWCISRQRYFGVPFPVWYCKGCGEAIVADMDQLPVDPVDDAPGKCCSACGGEEYAPETDVMDTWATSSLTPQIALDWVEGSPLMDTAFPMDLRPQAHDIISFWAFNTIVKAHFHQGDIPWRDIMISGFVKLEGGKMSKSKGNIIEPMEVVEAYSGDALRYWAATGASLGEDIIYREKELTRGQRFITKLQNVQAFIGNVLGGVRSDSADATSPSGGSREGEVSKKPPEVPADELPLMDRWLLTAYSDLVDEVTALWEDFDYTKATKQVENFLWHTVADHYLELVKHRLPRDGAPDPAAAYTLYTVGLGTLKLLAPIICFVTEDIYQSTYRGLEGHKSVHVAPWPEAVLHDDAARRQGEVVKDVIAEVRSWKSGKGLPLNAPLPRLEVVAPDAARDALEAAAADVAGTLKTDGLEFVDASEVEERPVAVKPVHAKLGPKYRAKAGAIVKALEAMDPKRAAEDGPLKVDADGETVGLEPDEYEVVTRPAVHGHEVEAVHAGEVTVLAREE